jgi:type III pantothenate kinase
MLLAIDVGNTHTVYGAWDGSKWAAIWRRRTDPDDTEDELGVWLKGLFDLQGLPWEVDIAICASVVPAVNSVLERLAQRWLGGDLKFLRNGAQVGIHVTYDPPTAVGADRIANALAALEQFQPPIVVVDLGTATTFDTIDAQGTYLGGAIMPGVIVSSEALFARAARLPHVDQLSFVAPESAIGKNTMHALQSGLMYGYAGAIDSLATRISAELGGNVKVIATGGLGAMFLGLCQTLQSYEPNLTLDGLRIASSKLCRDAG